ncbi:hypothetical protein K2V61_12635 [Staphylococcus simulans]|uniref:hypothetical protein n=1 Tax=Staphylococcus simulans TaxID=1286 RepID=UPI001E50DCBA|nr:hypothetical protein [Staphylococcus simulans]MCD8916386.1 hypothetical protein [Staphylococcus simulans]
MKIRFTDALLEDLEAFNITKEKLLNYYYVGTYSFETEQGTFEYAENKLLNSDEIMLDSMYSDRLDLFGQSGIVVEVDENYNIIK